MSVRHDVVIVGAGPAGCVMAARLSQRPDCRVLLLEAGTDPGLLSADVVAARTRGAEATPYRLGRGVGGGSAVNAMIGMWGVPADYDRWERDLGCAGWSWADVRPVFASLPVPLTHVPQAEWGDVDRSLVDAALGAGHAFDTDYNRAGSIGVGPAWLTRRNGRRASIDDVYLRPARTRPNLTVRPDTAVDHLLLDRATVGGVLTTDGEVIEAGEVIVCAGAIQSPLLLLRSGIDHPAIGHGLKDHVSASITLELRQPADVGGIGSATLLRWSSTTEEADLQLLPLNHVGVAGYGALMAAVMSAHSSGTVGVGGDGAPLVRFDLLDDERDRTRLREAFRHMAALTDTEPFQRIARGVYVDSIGTPLAALADDDRSLDEWLAAHVGDYVHAGGTCRMG
ncbi:MAG TPA: GMC family oxidoreductase N-terminal domain-containing protein, partial [Ilumatobacteraceae bacterium]